MQTDCCPDTRASLLNTITAEQKRTRLRESNSPSTPERLVRAVTDRATGGVEVVALVLALVVQPTGVHGGKAATERLLVTRACPRTHVRALTVHQHLAARQFAVAPYTRHLLQGGLHLGQEGHLTVLRVFNLDVCH